MCASDSYWECCKTPFNLFGRVLKRKELDTTYWGKDGYDSLLCGFFCFDHAHVCSTWLLRVEVLEDILFYVKGPSQH